MITANAELKKIYDIIKDIDSSCFSRLASDTSSALSSLNTNLNSVIDRLGMRDVWNDSVSKEIGGSVRAGFSSMIEECKNPACSILNNIGSSVGGLVSNLDTYLDKVEEHNRLCEEQNRFSLNRPSEYTINKKGYRVNNPDFIEWNRQMSAYNSLIANLKTVISQLEESCKSQIDSLRGLLSPIASAASSSALSLNVSTSVRRENISLGNGGNKVVVSTYDENGKLVSESYTIYDNSSKERGYGSIKYDEAGNMTIEEYMMYQEDGSIRYGTKDYNDPSNVKDTYFIINKDGTSTNGETISDESGDVIESSIQTIGEDGAIEVEETATSNGDVSRIESMIYNADGIGNRTVTITDENGNVIHEQKVGLIGIPDDAPITIDGNKVTLNFNPNTYEGYDHIDKVLTELGVTSQGDKNKYINLLTWGERELEINGKTYIFNLDGNQNGDVAGEAFSQATEVESVSNPVTLSSAASDVGNHAGARSNTYATMTDAITDFEAQGLSHEDAALAAEEALARGDYTIGGGSQAAEVETSSKPVTLSSAASDVGNHAGARSNTYATMADAITDFEAQGLSHEDAALAAEESLARGDYTIGGGSNTQAVEATSTTADSSLDSNKFTISDNYSTMEDGITYFESQGLSHEDAALAAGDVLARRQDYADSPSFNKIEDGEAVLYNGEKYFVLDKDEVNGSARLTSVNPNGSANNQVAAVAYSPAELTPLSPKIPNPDNTSIPAVSNPVSGTITDFTSASQAIDSPLASGDFNVSTTSSVNPSSSISASDYADSPSFLYFEPGSSVEYNGEVYSVKSIDSEDGINGSVSLSKINADGTIDGKVAAVAFSPAELMPYYENK